MQNMQLQFKHLLLIEEVLITIISSSSSDFNLHSLRLTQISLFFNEVAVFCIVRVLGKYCGGENSNELLRKTFNVEKGIRTSHDNLSQRTGTDPSLDGTNKRRLVRNVCESDAHLQPSGLPA